jgi:hypothetical protein
MTSRNSLAALGLLAVIGTVTYGLGGARSGVAAASQASVQPNAFGEMDCNGWSPTYQSVAPAMKMRCVDPISIYAGRTSRFYDNGHYVGHDEPTTKFISSAPRSGNTMTYLMQLSRDPSATPTTTPVGSTVSRYAELSVAPWFGLPLCDPFSYPGGACSSDSDANTTAAGDAFMELQFYPPGFGPGVDGVSYDPMHWVSALNIDSLACIAGGGCNPNCMEPVNFAILTRDGQPTGPPSPQLANYDTFTTNSDTLLMNPGDTLKVSVFEVPDSGSPDVGGLATRIDDLTTGQGGFIIASAANGFMHTTESSCAGTPYSFHAEYATAKQANQVGWAALEGGVLMQDEIGHFEPCSSVTHAEPLSFGRNGQTFSDPSIQQTCNGAFEAQNSSPTTGEGPCTSFSPCPGATTEGTTFAACPSSAAACELSDAFCIPSGSRTVTINGVGQTWSQPIAGCVDNRYQNGDLDYDGSPYIADWPDRADTSNGHPTSFRYLGPFDAAGNQYPQTQFETDGPGSENNCNVSAPTPSTCKVPPDGAAFYPFWSMTNAQGLDGVTTSPAGACVWNFGNDITSVTTNDFSKDAQYGSASSHYGGTLISAPVANPAITSPCPTVTEAGALPQSTNQTVSVVSTKQFTLANSDGATWRPVACDAFTTCSSGGTGSNVSTVVTPASDGMMLLSGNSDLWTYNAGYNQDIGITVSGGGVYPTHAGQPEVWKESGGLAGVFSPNTAYVQGAIPVTHGIAYTVTLVWKTSKNASGAMISAGAGPLGGVYSPSRFTAVVVPTSQVNAASSTKQFTFPGSDGSKWVALSCLAAEVHCSPGGTGDDMTLTVTPASDGTLIVGANADLWTFDTGYNQDLGILVTGGGVYPTVPGQPEAWKESGGAAGTFSPNAAYVQAAIPVTHGVTYMLTPAWKASKNAAGKTISAGAGPIGGIYSPTSMVAAFVPAVAGPLSVASTAQFALANSDGGTWQRMECGVGQTTCSASGAGGLSMTFLTPPQSCTAVLSANSDLWTYDSGVNQDIAIFVNGSLVAWKESGGSAGTFSPNAAFVSGFMMPLSASTAYTVDVRWKSSAAAGGKTISAGAGPIGGNYSPTRLTADLTICS